MANKVWTKNGNTDEVTINSGEVFTVRGLTFKELGHFGKLSEDVAAFDAFRLAVVDITGLKDEDGKPIDVEYSTMDINGNEVKALDEEFANCFSLDIIVGIVGIIQELTKTDSPTTFKRKTKKK
jgi:hypothetical protein